MKKRILKSLLYTAKLVLTVVIMWFVLRGTDLTQVLSTMLSISPGVLALLCLGTLIRFGAQLQNWRYALCLNPSYQPNTADVWRSYLIGLPLRFVIPGGPAAVGKILFVDNSSHWASVLSFGAERFFMTWATWLVAAVAASLHYTFMPLWIRVAVVTLCLIFPLLAFFGLARMPKLKALRSTYPRQAPKMILAQILASAAMYAQYWLILRQMLPIDFTSSFRLMGLTNFSNSIPVTVAGLGLRESFAVHFLKDWGYTATQAVSATLILFVIQDIVPALIGSIVLLSSKRKGRNAPAAE